MFISDKPDHVVLKPLKLVCEKNVEELEAVGLKNSRIL